MNIQTPMTDQYVRDPKEVFLNPTRAGDWFGVLIALALFTGLTISAVNLAALSLIANEWFAWAFTPILWWFVVGELVVARTESLSRVRHLVAGDVRLAKILTEVARNFSADVERLGLKRVRLRFGRGRGHYVAWQRFGHVVVVDTDLLAHSIRGDDAAQRIRSVILHELAHVWFGDVSSLGLTQISFAVTFPVILLNAAIVTPRFLVFLPLYSVVTWLSSYIARRRESQADALAVFIQGGPSHLSHSLATLHSGLTAHGALVLLQRRFARSLGPEPTEAPSLVARLATAWAQHYSPELRSQIVTEEKGYFLRFGRPDMFAFGVITAVPPCLAITLLAVAPSKLPSTYLNEVLTAIPVFSFLAAPFLIFTFLRLLANCLILSGEAAQDAALMIWEIVRGLLFAVAIVVPVVIVTTRGIAEAMLLIPLIFILALKVALLPVGYLHFFIARCCRMRERMPPGAFRRAALWMRLLFFGAFIVTNGALVALQSRASPDNTAVFAVAILGLPACLLAAGVLERWFCARSAQNGANCAHCGATITYQFLSVALDQTIPLDYLQACQDCGRLQSEHDIFVAQWSKGV